MNNLGLSITFEVIDKASAQFKQLNAQFSNMSSNWSKMGATMARGLAVGAAAIGAVAVTAAAAIAGLTNKGMDAIAEMSKLSSQLGISVEQFSGLAYAAQASGATIDDLEGSLSSFNEAMFDSADKTSEMADIFKYLGVSVRDSSGNMRNMADVFLETADALSKLPDGANKANLIIKMLGEEGLRLNKMMNQGADGIAAMIKQAEELGMIVDSKTAKQVDEFKQSMMRLNTAVTGAGIQIATELAPTINLLAREFVSATKQGTGFRSFVDGVGTAFRWVIKVIATAVNTVTAFGKGIGAVMAATAAAASGEFSQASSIMKEWIADVNAIDKANEDFKKSIDESDGSVEKNTKSVAELNQALNAGAARKKDFVATSKDAAKASEEEKKAFDALKKAMVDQLAGVSEMSAEETVRHQIAQKVAGTLKKSNQDELLSLSKRVDAMKALNAQQDQYVQGMIGAQTTADSVKRSYDDLRQVIDNLSATESSKASSGRIQAVQEVANAYRAQEDVIRGMVNELNVLNSSEALRSANTNRILELETRIEGAKKAYAEIDDKIRTDTEAQLLLTQQMTKDVETWRQYIGDTADQQERLTRSGELLARWLEQGKITLDQYNIAVTHLNENVESFNNSTLTKTQQKVRDVATQFQGAFEDIFFNVMQGKFDGIVQSFKQMLDRMVAQALAANLAGALFGENFLKGGAVGGQAGGLLGSFVGMFNFRANGGPVTAGQPYIVGERQAEVFVPSVSGTILPSVSALAGMNAGATQVNFNVQAMDAASFLSKLDEIKRPLTQMIQGTQRTYNMRTA